MRFRTKYPEALCYILLGGPNEAHERIMTPTLFFKIILMFVFLFSFLGFCISPWIENEKIQDEVGFWCLILTIFSLIGILILS